MNSHHTRSLISYIFPLGFFFMALSAGLIYGLVKIYTLEQKINALSSELNSTNLSLLSNTDQLTRNLTDLNKKTTGLSSTISFTQQNIDAVKTQVGGVEQSVGSISGTVSTLQKLAQSDPQLLKKYSKVYFMNENYVPAHLSPLPTEYTFSSTREEQFLTEAKPYLITMIENAKINGVTLYVKSGYRSFSEQKSLKSSYSVTYGAGTANAFSAEQGYSEHQLGTTIDFTTTGLNGGFNRFDATEAYAWLSANGYRFGFVLSYPKGNKYYVYEPWHWRFVGVKLATYLHEKNMNFYDLDQREVDKYLVSMFD